MSPELREQLERTLEYHRERREAGRALADAAETIRDSKWMEGSTIETYHSGAYDAIESILKEWSA